FCLAMVDTNGECSYRESSSGRTIAAAGIWSRAIRTTRARNRRRHTRHFDSRLRRVQGGQLMQGVVSWLGAWLLFIVLAVVLSKTAWGKTVVYYVLWLSILLLVVTRSDEIASLFKAGNISGES